MFNKLIILFSLAFASQASKLQVGDNLERRSVDLSKFNNYSDFEKKAILATVKILNGSKKSLGTGFAYKSVGDEILFITNNHVLKDQRECRKTKVSILSDDLKVKILSCDKVLSIGDKNHNLDYTIFSLSQKEYVGSIFKNRLINIANTNASIGESVLTAGFGSRSFDERKFDITISSDKDCSVLAGPRTIVMQDFPMKNTMSLGCDASSGDSGSMVLSQESGEIVGIFFGTAILKKKNQKLTSKEMQEHLGEENYLKFWTATSWATSIEVINNIL